MRPTIRPAVLLLPLAMASLVGGVWAGLLRLSWQMPAPAHLAPLHGPIMVGGFLGTLIALERATALRGASPYLVPALAAVGATSLLSGVSVWLGAPVLAASSLGLVALYGVILQRGATEATWLMIAGASAWAIGNCLWVAGLAVFQVVGWWQAFIVFTIAGERLELGRVYALPRSAVYRLVAAVAIALLGLCGASTGIAGSRLLVGSSWTVIAVWLLSNDGSIRARAAGPFAALHRYMATCLISGYAWLAAAGVLMVLVGEAVAGPGYDAVQHAVFLGFAFAMIFAHAPIVAEVVLGVRVPFRGVFYVPLFALNASLVARVAGDLLAVPVARRWGGLANAASLALFIAAVAGSAVARVRSERQGAERSEAGGRKQSVPPDPSK
jgi:hypothetical protein